MIYNKVKKAGNRKKPHNTWKNDHCSREQKKENGSYVQGTADFFFRQLSLDKRSFDQDQEVGPMYESNRQTAGTVSPEQENWTDEESYLSENQQNPAKPSKTPIPQKERFHDGTEECSIAPYFQEMAEIRGFAF